jgi:argininosuccinate lyase
MVMVVEEGIISREKGAKILEIMLEMDEMGSTGFPFEEGKGNIYLNMESYLLEKLGEDLGGWAYIGRSRLDYEATIRRIYVRDELAKVIKGILKLIRVMLRRATEHNSTIMPGYSHLQHSQPCTFGHYLLSFADAFLKDIERFKGAFGRTDLNPLGSAAAAGEALGLNRSRTTELLGFSNFLENSREACFSRDYAAESYGCCSIFMSNLGQLATDLDLFCTQEFNMVELADEYSGTSSFMPQKKNPLPLEAIRAYSGFFIGVLPSVLGVMKTNSEEVDIIEFTPDFDLGAYQMLADMAELMGGVVATMNIKEATMRDRAYSHWSTASALALLISRKANLSWRTGHRIVGRLVREALSNGITPLQATEKMLKKAAEEILGEELMLEISTEGMREVLDPGNFITTRCTQGSTNPEEVKRMAQDRAVRLEQKGQWIEEKQAHIRNAYNNLRRIAREIAQTS